MKLYYNFIDYCIIKMANKESLNDLSVDDLAMTLDENLCNQTVDVLKIVAIFMKINRDAVNRKSKRHVKKLLKRFMKTYWRMQINQSRIRKHI